MRALILAAGFGTRMGAITATIAKPMLPVAGKPVVEHLADKIYDTGLVSGLTVITNAFYFEQFKNWADNYSRGEILLINNLAMSNGSRLGAIADMKRAVAESGYDESFLIMAGDNIFEFDFSEIIKFHNDTKSDVVAAYRQPDIEKLRKTGVAVLDGEGIIAKFQEKPLEPESDVAVPCLYVFLPGTLRLIQEYLNCGMNPDATGNFIKWLSVKAPVRAHIFDEPLHSIGDAASYERTKKLFEK